MPHRLAALAVACLTACTKVTSQQPALVGTYAIESTLVSNGCGAGGLSIPAVSDLAAEVRGYAGESAQFRWTNGGTIVAGSASSNGTYDFESTTARSMIAADTSTGYAGCTLTEHTSLTFTVVPTPIDPGDAAVDSGASADAGTSTLTGSITIDIYPTSTSDCTPLLGVNGGSWLAVPCQAQTTLTGTRMN